MTEFSYVAPKRLPVHSPGMLHSCDAADDKTATSTPKAKRKFMLVLVLVQIRGVILNEWTWAGVACHKAYLLVRMFTNTLAIYDRHVDRTNVGKPFY